MTESKGGMRRIGQERWKYLDMSTMAFAAGDYIQTEGYLKGFLDTIKNDSEEGNFLKGEFDRIELEKRNKLKDLEEQIRNLGYLEQRDYQERGRTQIEIEAVHNRKTVCWTTAMQMGLFND